MAETKVMFCPCAVAGAIPPKEDWPYILLYLVGLAAMLWFGGR